ncbi:Protoglobin-domain-containing protein [Polychytrium aggregatum]|uniref:Protoglobin-domain-containing protein n=1 Tax=Polychytrium aggregatum TaxID=110093 RepID=UPI0022FE185C|nr:Protoglobin-domain-containing protein [Polychytrium aggregatum]KAI9208894.1 Protoglobin-domain-containing protein [Polychytrium aggregatum]
MPGHQNTVFLSTLVLGTAVAAGVAYYIHTQPKRKVIVQAPRSIPDAPSLEPSLTNPALIDRDRLYTDRLYRFQYLCSFADFDDSDIAAIKASAPLIAPLVPTIVDAVYERLFSFDITKSSFTQKNEGFEGEVSDLDHLTLDHEQIKFRKNHLKGYLVKLVSAEYDAKFVNYLDWVGRIHVRNQLKASKINVEYVHINALFAFLHGFLAETLSNLPDLQRNPKVRTKTLAAFSKLLWIQNDFFVKYYVKDGRDLIESAPENQVRSV